MRPAVVSAPEDNDNAPLELRTIDPAYLHFPDLGCSHRPCVDGLASNVRVEGGTVTNFSFGIFLSALNSRVSGVTVTDNCGYGIIALARDGVIDTSVVTRNEVGGIAVAEGFLGPVTNFTLHSNHVSGNDDFGIYVMSDGNTIRSNVVSDNHQTGIRVAGRRNIVRSNVTIGNSDGISLLDSSRRTTVTDNKANGNANAGIVLAVGSGLNAVIANRARGNGIVDLSDGNAGCDANRWRRNIFAIDSVGGVSDDGPGAGCIQ